MSVLICVYVGVSNYSMSVPELLCGCEAAQIGWTLLAPHRLTHEWAEQSSMRRVWSGAERCGYQVESLARAQSGGPVCQI